MSRPKILFTFALFGAPACADKIAHEHPDAAVAGDSGAVDAAPPAGKVRTTRGADGTYTTIVDSTSMTDWTYADFETGMEAPTTAAWDLRFQRFHISTNGGVSGSGGVEVAPITGTTFAAVTAAPSTGYLRDAADGNGDGMPDYAFEQGDGWYDYDPATHVLAPKPTVWVLKTDGGSTLKLEILKYYDLAGTAGWFTFHWGPL